MIDKSVSEIRFYYPFVETETIPDEIEEDTEFDFPEEDDKPPLDTEEPDT